jgi:outer membrane protein assembly factor BamB
MMAHDLHHTGMAATKGPSFYKAAWQDQLGCGVDLQSGSVFGVSAVVGGSGEIYIPCDIYLYSIHPTGAVAWRRALGTLGGCSTPAVSASGTVYVGGCNGKLYAFSSAGARLWAFATSRPIESAPAVNATGSIFFGDANGYLYALRPTGALEWRFFAGTPLNSSPAIGAGGTVYVGGANGHLYAVRPDGTLKWTFRTAPEETVSMPAIGPGGDVYVGVSGYTGAAGLYAITPSGTLAWNSSLGEGTPAVDRLTGDIYSAGGPGLVAFDAAGTPLWHYSPGGEIDSPVSIGSDGTIYLSSDDGGPLTALTPTGKVLWSHVLKFDEFLFQTAIVGATGTLYVPGAYSGYFYSVR